MKKSTLMMLSIAAVTGLAGIANATPLGINDVAQGGAGGAVNQTAQNVGPTVSQNAQNGGLSSQNAPGLTTTSNSVNSVNSVPVSGSTLILLGAGFAALAIWHRRYRGGLAA
jgi:hypothetical protein